MEVITKQFKAVIILQFDNIRLSQRQVQLSLDNAINHHAINYSRRYKHGCYLDIRHLLCTTPVTFKFP